MYLLQTKSCLVINQFRTFKAKYHLILLKQFFKPKLVNNPVASWLLINIGVLLSLTPHFNKSIIFPLFAFANLGFVLSIFFQNFKQ